MTAQEKRLVIAKVLKKSVLAIFKTHTYSFGQIISTNWSQINLQSRKKLVSWVSWIPRNIYKNVKIEEHSVKMSKNVVAFHVK